MCHKNAVPVHPFVGEVDVDMDGAGPIAGTGGPIVPKY